MLGYSFMRGYFCYFWVLNFVFHAFMEFVFLEVKNIDFL